MTCPHRIAMPGGQDKQGPPDNYANMCEARRLFALAWSAWAREARPADLAEELAGSIGQITAVACMAAGIDAKAKS